MVVDDKTLQIRVASYNGSTGENLTVDELINSYNENGDEFTGYNDWYKTDDGRKHSDAYKEAVNKALEVLFDVESVDAASAEQVDEAICLVEEAVEIVSEDEGTVTKENLDDIKKWMGGK